MDWKSYYRREMELPETKRYLETLFRQAVNDELLDDLIACDAILSFPHTSLNHAGAIQARVVSALYKAEIERVVALGVFHEWGLDRSSELYRQAMEDRVSSHHRLAAFSVLAGAFVPTSLLHETPFGGLPIQALSTKGASFVRLDTDGALSEEFSLDTFLSLIRFYAGWHKVNPPQVLPVYIGMTRDPITGSFDVASGIASSIRGITGPNTAIVATGDLVHYGTAYSSKERMAGMPSTIKELEGIFIREVQYTLDLSLIDKNYEEAFQQSDQVLNNDQRYLLPVLAELLPKKASYRILSFQLSNYAPILKVAEPCVVASSLIAYIPDREGNP